MNQCQLVVSFVMILTFAYSSPALAVRVLYEYSGTWHAPEQDKLGLDGRSLSLRLELDRDSVPVEEFSTINLVGATYATQHFELVIDGFPAPINDVAYVRISDSLSATEPDRILFHGFQFASTEWTDDLVLTLNTIELSVDSFDGIMPQPFRSADITQFSQIGYGTPVSDCSMGELCIPAFQVSSYELQNGLAAGILVPEPATKILGTVLIVSGVLLRRVRRSFRG